MYIKKTIFFFLFLKTSFFLIQKKKIKNQNHSENFIILNLYNNKNTQYSIKLKIKNDLKFENFKLLLDTGSSVSWLYTNDNKKNNEFGKDLKIINYFNGWIKGYNRKKKFAIYNKKFFFDFLNVIEMDNQILNDSIFDGIFGISFKSKNKIISFMKKLELYPSFFFDYKQQKLILGKSFYDLENLNFVENENFWIVQTKNIFLEFKANKKKIFFFKNIKKAIFDTGNSFIILNKNSYNKLKKLFYKEFECKNKIYYIFNIRFKEKDYRVNSNDLVIFDKEDCLNLITFDDSLENDTILLGDSFLRHFKIYFDYKMNLVKIN